MPRLLTFYAIIVVIAVVFIAFVRSSTFTSFFWRSSFFSLCSCLAHSSQPGLRVCGRHHGISSTVNLVLGVQTGSSHPLLYLTYIQMAAGAVEGMSRCHLIFQGKLTITFSYRCLQFFFRSFVCLVQSYIFRGFLRFQKGE